MLIGVYCGHVVYRCFFADQLRSTVDPLFIGFSLRICCRSTAGPLFIVFSLQIHCASAAGPLHLAGPLFTGVFFANRLRICCGSTAGPLFIGLSLQIILLDLPYTQGILYTCCLKYAVQMLRYHAETVAINTEKNRKGPIRHRKGPHIMILNEYMHILNTGKKTI